jgi:hypothetical protein
MGAIGVMLVLAMAELALQIVVTSVSMRLLFSAAQDKISFVAQQASLEQMYDIIVFIEDVMLVTNKFVTNTSQT